MTKSNPPYKTLYWLTVLLYIATVTLAVVVFALFMRWEEANGSCSPTALLHDASKALSQGFYQVVKP